MGRDIGKAKKTSHKRLSTVHFSSGIFLLNTFSFAFTFSLHSVSSAVNNNTRSNLKQVRFYKIPTKSPATHLTQPVSSWNENSTQTAATSGVEFQKRAMFSTANSILVIPEPLGSTRRGDILDSRNNGPEEKMGSS